MPHLYVVATPIGNLSDLTRRMEEALRGADLIAAEDTRVTRKLLNHLEIKTPMVSYHQHNEASRTGELIARMLAEDLTVALTCDAGTPCISDPGAQIVRAAHAAGIPVTPVSGPSAVVTAISASGFDARTFAFYGFPPREKKPLRDHLSAIRRTGIPLAVLYESPHRIVKLMEEIVGEWPECAVCVCCDLSKRYESILTGPCAEVLAQLSANPNVQKGEYCLVCDLSALPPVNEPPQRAETAELLILEQWLEGGSLNEATARAQAQGLARNEAYRAKLRIQDLFGTMAQE